MGKKPVVSGLETTVRGSKMAHASPTFAKEHVLRTAKIKNRKKLGLTSAMQMQF